MPPGGVVMFAYGLDGALVSCFCAYGFWGGVVLFAYGFEGGVVLFAYGFEGGIVLFEYGFWGVEVFFAWLWKFW